jgi:hypothetical protein
MLVMFGTAESVRDLATWLASLDRPFAFLLALPFAVALAGLISEYVRHHCLKGSASRRKKDQDDPAVAMYQTSERTSQTPEA